MSELHVRLLQRAAEKLGGVDEVAHYLEVPDVRIRIWMRGIISPSDEVFLRLVDLLQEAPPRPVFPVHSASSSRRRGKP